MRVVAAALVAFLLTPQLVVSQPARTTATTSSADYQKGRSDGESAGKSDFGAGQAACWFAGGFFIIGVPLAYIMKSEPPTAALLGKPQEYALGYSEGYKKKVNGGKQKWAWIGCLTEIVASLIMNAAGGNE